MLYLIESVVVVCFSPDKDVINGYKNTFQQLQQSIIMLVAALTATDNITAESGAAVLILLGIIQVAIAMPEQIMNSIRTFILKKGNGTSAPDFPMTAAELDLKAEISMGMDKKFYTMKDLLSKILAMKPHMLAGNVEEVFRSILMDKELMNTLNRLSPGCLNPLFGSLFTLDPVIQGLVALKHNIVILKYPVDKLLTAEWNHCVDFKLGLDALYEIKETIEIIGLSVGAMMKGNFQEAMNMVMGSTALLGCLASANPDVLRILLRQAFQPPAVQQAIRASKQKVPTDLHYKFEALLTFINELDENDLDVILLDFGSLVNSFKFRTPETSVKDMPGIPAFYFPGSILNSVDPIDILNVLGTEIPAPFDQVSTFFLHP